MTWHSLNAVEAAKEQEVNVAVGLTAADAAARREQHGPNALAEKPPRSKWLLLLDQFRSVLILILIGAAVLAGALGSLKDPIVIMFVVLLNATLGFWQEHRAEATLAALKKMLAPVARVRRDGRMEEIPATELVPGDIVLLEAGDRVPADGRLVVTHNVEIDEAALTGESQPVGKDAGALFPEDAPLAERLNMAFMNTVVTRGRAELLVTGTGMVTEMGRLSGMLSEAESGPTPLQIQLDSLGRRIAIIAGAVIGLMFVLGKLQGDPWMDVIMTSVALAVASIPEGLPAVVTVTLALGMHRMAKRRAIVKKLSAVETLGCTTVICSDKTGTLTMNQMTARAVVFRGQRFTVSGEGYDSSGRIEITDGRPAPDFLPMLYPAALANESRIADGRLIGDPTEGALLALAGKGGVDVETLRARSPRVAEIPFDSAYKFQATFHDESDVVRVYVKGAPDVLLTRASSQPIDGTVEALDAAYWHAENDRLAGEAMRVLAVAEKSIPASEFDPAGDLMAHVNDLTFVALVGIIDPPRPEAREAIALCKRAGIQVKMITGDHRITAAAIARELGLEGEVVEGRELDGMSPEELTARINQVSVFARVAPEHKVRIVQALRELGHIAAMTGDGVNDAPALKNADIGVAMGITGTEVSKEAATMVLTDDNFATIVSAVKEGRAIYDNIVKFVRFQLSTNMGAIQTMLYAGLMGWATPFTPIQILWVNIIMDGPPAMTLGVEPARPGVMEDPPRRTDARILTARRLLRLFFYGLIMAIGTLGIMMYGEDKGELYAGTLAFTTFVLFQFFNLFNARNEHGTAFNRQLFKNRWLWMALSGVVLLQIVAVHWDPAQFIFRTTDLTLADWGLCIAIASSVLVVEEVRKGVGRLIRRLSAGSR